MSAAFKLWMGVLPVCDKVCDATSCCAAEEVTPSVDPAHLGAALISTNRWEAENSEDFSLCVFCCVEVGKIKTAG